MYTFKKIILLLLLSTFANANNIKSIELAKSLNLSAGSKAIVQWERVFKSERKMKRYKIDTLTLQQKNALKEYLIEHAIDSDKPTIAGI